MFLLDTLFMRVREMFLFDTFFVRVRGRNSDPIGP